MFKERFTATIVKKDNKTNLKFAGDGLYLRQRLSILPEGKEVLVTITVGAKKRSEVQNNLYWLYLAIISEETGENDKESLHELFKIKFLKTGHKEVFIPSQRKKYIVPLTDSTTKLTKGEFVEYMLQIEEFTGIPIPDTQAWREFL